MKDTDDASLVRRSQVTRNHEKKRTLSILQESYTKSVLERYCMLDYHPLSTARAVSELSLNQPVENCLNAENNKHPSHAIVRSVMYLGPVVMVRYDIPIRGQPAGAHNAITFEVHMAAAKQLLRYLAGTTTDFNTTYSKEGFKLKAYSDAN